MKVLVCGSRTWSDADAVRERLLELPPESVVIHGGARGADVMAATTATALGLSEQAFLPDWRRLGKRAGIVRNLEMLDEAPDLVIAFWDGDSIGTKHTIDEAKRRGIPVELIAERVGP